MSSKVSSVGALHATLGLDTADFSEGASRAQALANKLNADISKIEQGAGKAQRGFGVAGKAMGDFTKSAGAARAANANLFAQFNDIGVMLAAGQNPLQLAMQQGTQISQVLSQMGGGMGAVKALGSAFVGMLNPISIATIGVIGFGAAAIQWLMPAKKEAEKVKSSFDQLKDSVKSYQDALSVSLLYTGKAEADYGQAAQKGAEIARRVMEIEARKTQESVKAILLKAYEDVGAQSYGNNPIDGKRAHDTNSMSYMAEQMGFKGSWLLGGPSMEDIAVARQYAETMREIYQFANDPKSMDGGLDAFNTSLADRLEVAQQILNKAIEQGAAEENIAAIRKEINDLQTQAYMTAQQIAIVKAAEEAKAAEMLSSLEHQLYISDLIKQHGQDSLIVRQAELQAEYEKQLAGIESLKIAEDEKLALYDSASALYDAKIATAEWADEQARVNASLQAAASIIASIGGGAINNAARAAGRAVMAAGGTAAQVRIAEERSRALSAAQRDLQTGKLTPEQYADVRNSIDTAISEREAYKAELDALTAAEREAAKAAKGGGGKKSGGGSRSKLSDAQREAERDAKRQKDAYKQLQEQVGLLQAGIGKTALEQRILNEQQKIGSAASPEVVAALVRQQHALEQMQNAIENMRSSFVDAFADIVTGAKSMADAVAGILKNLAAQLAQKAGNSLFDAALGALSGSFGGAGRVVGNDALSSALRAIPGFATGVTGFAGGLAMVGERGPELVNLPRGSNVITNENTNKLLNSMGSQSPQIHVSVDEGLKVQLLNDAAKQSANITKAGIQQYSRSGLAADVKRLGGTRTMING